MQALEGKKAAVIGLGRMGLEHIGAYKSVGAVVVAGADIKEEARKLAETRSPGIRIYADWQELLAKETPDIVSIVTNGPSHAEITIAAAGRKVPIIFCEKPMTTSMANANRMLEACKMSGSKLIVNLTLRVFPSFEKLLALLHAGEIGEIRSVSVVISGRRGLGCVGTHYLDIMRVIIGSNAVRAWGRIDKTGTPNVRGPQFKDPGGYGIYEFENGARGFIEMSEDLWHRPFMSIIGTLGKVLVDMTTNKWGDKIGKRVEVHKLVAKEGSPDPDIVHVPFDTGERTDNMAGTTLALEDIGRNGGKMGTGEDGRAALEMVMALHISDLRGNQLIDLPLSGKDLDYDVPMT